MKFYSNIIIAMAAVAAGIASTSCSGESETAKAARLLYEQAQSLNIQGNPVGAIALLDSIQRAYPAEVEWQRAAMKLRPTLIINSTEQQMLAIDDSIVAMEQRYNSLLPAMKRVSDPRLVEPYYVAAAIYDPSFMDGTGVQPRVSDIGQFYFVSSVNPGGLKHTGFTLECDGESVAVGPVPYDGELNYRINGSEVITYSPDQSSLAGRFASLHRDRAMNLILTGEKRRVIKLNARQVNAIADCYDMSTAIVDARQLSFEKERLSRQLDIARSQAERLSAE